MQFSRHRRPLHLGEQGYVLLTLLLMVTVLTIAAAAVLPTISFEIRRDREEELIHRGVQYSRAIRSYYKKFGRYPTKLEDLESTNNLRFLRKRYKDPITGQDFKLLHFGEVKMTFNAPLTGVSNINGAISVDNSGGSQPVAPAGGSFGAQPTGFAAAARPGSPDNTNATPDQNQSSDSNSPGQNPDGAQGQQPSSSDPLASKTFGGGPIVGVISTSKKDSIREFNHKKKYSEWQFIYDPATDRGGLLSTPNQPPLQGIGTQIQQVNPSGMPPAGMQNNPNPPPGGPGTPTPPNNPPDQQQQ
jgi:type II secretory pathway pseudopilin PulG